MINEAGENERLLLAVMTVDLLYIYRNSKLAPDDIDNVLFIIVYEPFRCIDLVLVENCKKATSIHFFISQESQI